MSISKNTKQTSLTCFFLLAALVCASAGPYNFLMVPDRDSNKNIYIRKNQTVAFYSNPTPDDGHIESYYWSLPGTSEGFSDDQSPGLVTYTSDGEMFEVTLQIEHIDGNNQNCANPPNTVAYVVFPKLEFKRIGSWKIVDPMVPHKDVRIGVLLNDSVDFRAKFPTGHLPQSSEISWSGEQTGTGDSINVAFNAVGAKEMRMNVRGSETNSASITVANPTGLGEAAWLAPRPWYYFAAPALRDEARAWASGENNEGDARRHAYWNAIMTTDWNSADAEGLATAHEVSGLSTAQHNSVPMDLENNTAGRAIGSPGATRASLKAAVVGALNSGGLIILDNPTNSNEVGLLQPSNQ